VAAAVAKAAPLNHTQKYQERACAHPQEQELVSTPATLYDAAAPGGQSNIIDPTNCIVTLAGLPL
jgi:hypothetical protein